MPPAGAMARGIESPERPPPVGGGLFEGVRDYCWVPQVDFGFATIITAPRTMPRDAIANVSA